MKKTIITIAISVCTTLLLLYLGRSFFLNQEIQNEKLKEPVITCVNQECEHKTSYQIQQIKEVAKELELSVEKKPSSSSEDETVPQNHDATKTLTNVDDFVDKFMDKKSMVPVDPYQSFQDEARAEDWATEHEVLLESVVQAINESGVFLGEPECRTSICSINYPYFADDNKKFMGTIGALADSLSGMEQMKNFHIYLQKDVENNLAQIVLREQ